MKHKTWSQILQASDDGEQEKTVNKVGLLARLQDLEYRGKILETVYLCIASFACGFVVCQRGPSILDLALISGVALQPASVLFSLGAGGYATGCLLAGLMFDRFCRQMFLFWALVGLCTATAILPWCVPYSAMTVFYFSGFVFVGSVETGCYAVVARLWGPQGGEVLKFLQLAFVIGGILSPAITPIFLISRPFTYNIVKGQVTHTNNSHIIDDVSTVDNQTYPTIQQSGSAQTTVITKTLTDLQHFANVADNITSTASSTNYSKREHLEQSKDSTTQLCFAFAVSAGVCLMASIPFLFTYVSSSKTELRCQMLKPVESAPEQERDQNSKEMHHRRWILIVVIVFFFLITAVEESFHQFLFTNMVYRARWTELWSSLLTSWFWCGVVVVKIAALFFPRLVSDETILILSCSSFICTLAVLHASLTFSSNLGVWVCVLLTGMSASQIIPFAFSWLHVTLMKNSSATCVSAVVMVASSIAGIVNPLVMGNLMQYHSVAWFSYLLLIEAGAVLVVLFLLVLVSRTLLTGWQAATIPSTDTEITTEKTEAMICIDEVDD